MNISITDEQADIIIGALEYALKEADMPEVFEFGTEINHLIKMITAIQSGE